MKKIATLFLVSMLLSPACLFGQTKKETTVKLEWHEQSFIHFYSPGYAVFVSKPDFLNIDNELLIGLFDEFAEKNDSIDLTDPFPYFKAEQKNLLWEKLMECASEGHMLILPTDSKKKLKNVVIIDEKRVDGISSIWECRDPRTNQLIFSRNPVNLGNTSSLNDTTP